MIKNNIGGVLTSLVAIILVFCNTSCTPNGGGTSVKPEILIFNYVVQPNGAPFTLGDHLESGSTHFDDLMPSSPCNFTADFSETQPGPGPLPIAVNPPDISLNGTFGQRGATVSIAVSNPYSLTETNPAGCDNIDSFAMTIGSATTTLSLGVPTDKSGAQVTVDGVRFDTTDVYFIASLNRRDPADGYKAGDFEFVGTNAAHDTIAIVSGSYAGH